jgi:hypothetical protein
MDYTIFYKTELNLETLRHQLWDVFISAYNDTERVQNIFTACNATSKFWIVHQEYNFSPVDYPRGDNIYDGSASTGDSEDAFVIGLLDAVGDLTGQRVCIDITGFMRPHLIFLIRLLADRGVKAFDALYTEPAQYKSRHSTQFARGNVTDVRAVAACGGSHEPSLSNDEGLVIIAAGYEHQLISQVAVAKNACRKIQLIGFPPLQADFYQENRMQVHLAAEALSAINVNQPIFAPANDPFVTAAVLQNTINRERLSGIKSVYLCPLASRPQALGFALYYLYEGRSAAVDIIYPFSPSYARETATGVGRIWKYEVEMPPV